MENHGADEDDRTHLLLPYPMWSSSICLYVAYVAIITYLLSSSRTAAPNNCSQPVTQHRLSPYLMSARLYQLSSGGSPLCFLHTTVTLQLPSVCPPYTPHWTNKHQEKLLWTQLLLVLIKKRKKEKRRSISHERKRARAHLWTDPHLVTPAHYELTR